MQTTSGNDLSLRHLPDLSNSSFSFDIPPGSNELLLDNDVDFFGVANDSFATPAPSRTMDQPLATPRTLARIADIRTHTSEKTVLSNSSHRNFARPPVLPENPKKASIKPVVAQKLGRVTRNEVLSTPQRMQRLRAEIKDLAETRYDPLGTFTTSSDSAEQEARKPNFRVSEVNPHSANSWNQSSCLSVCQEWRRFDTTHSCPGIDCAASILCSVEAEPSRIGRQDNSQCFFKWGRWHEHHVHRRWRIGWTISSVQRKSCRTTWVSHLFLCSGYAIDQFRF